MAEWIVRTAEATDEDRESLKAFKEERPRLTPLHLANPAIMQYCYAEESEGGLGMSVAEITEEVNQSLAEVSDGEYAASQQEIAMSLQWWGLIPTSVPLQKHMREAPHAPLVRIYNRQRAEA